MFNYKIFKKYLSVILFFFTILTLFPSQSFGNYSQNYFIVTAYYSPLEWQDYYLTWNYKDEIRLNGRWIAGASWKEVFSGMFAAPAKYVFWTKLYLEWLGAGSVEDRWWAIVPAWKRGYSHDRIDIWVWYWDEWLRRALYWGKRKISWSIISGGSDITFDYKDIPSPLWVTSWFKKISDIFSLNIWVNSDYKTIVSLQNFFKKIDLYKWNINWKYNSEIMNIVFEFQMRNNIITWESSLWAGYWWNKTRNLFLKKYLNWEFEKQSSDVISDKDVNIGNKYDTLFEWPVVTSIQISLLQELLIELGLYDWNLNGEYSYIKDVILQFQLDSNVIVSDTSIWAWVFWPKTKKSFKSYYLSFNENKARKIDLENKFKELELSAEKEASEKVESIWTPVFWDVSSKVRGLQQTLKLLWFFNYKDTAVFWQITKKSILDYQVENKLISSSSQVWAWVFWPKTKKSLKRSLKKYILTKKLEKQNLNKQVLLDIWVWSL